MHRTLIHRCCNIFLLLQHVMPSLGCNFAMLKLYCTLYCLKGGIPRFMDAKVISWAYSMDGIYIPSTSLHLMCMLLGCNDLSKSSKTLHCHFVQKHFNHAWFFICNQPIVNDVIYHFDTIHLGVLLYHGKHSLAH